MTGEVLRILVAVFAVVVAATLFAVPATMLIVWEFWMIGPVLAAMPFFAVGVVLGLHAWIDR